MLQFDDLSDERRRAEAILRGVINRILSGFLLLLFLATLLAAQSQKVSPSSVAQIAQAGTPLLYPADFVVTEDGLIFISDGKDGNIKCYEPNGMLLKVFGRRGPGPEEFMAPYFCDYQVPYFSVLDMFKIKIFERKGRAELVKIAEIPCMACVSDVILSGKGVLVDAFVHNNDGKFSLTLRSFGDIVLSQAVDLPSRMEGKMVFKAHSPLRI